MKFQKRKLLIGFLMSLLVTEINAQADWKQYLNLTSEKWDPVNATYYELSPVMLTGGRIYIQDGELVGDVKVWELHENNGYLGTALVNIFIMISAEAEAAAEAEKYGVGFASYELLGDKAAEADFQIFTGGVRGFDFATFFPLGKMGPGSAKIGLKFALLHGEYTQKDTGSVVDTLDYFYANFGIPLRYTLYYTKGLVLGADWDLNFLSFAVEGGSPLRLWVKYSIQDRFYTRLGFENGALLQWRPGLFMQLGFRF